MYEKIRKYSNSRYIFGALKASFFVISVTMTIFLFINNILKIQEIGRGVLTL